MTSAPEKAQMAIAFFAMVASLAWSKRLPAALPGSRAGRQPETGRIITPH